MPEPFLSVGRDYSNRWLFVLAVILLSGLGGCDGSGNQADQHEALLARLGSLESAIREQGASLNQILAAVSPAELSPEWENGLKQLEEQASNDSQWPKNPDEAEQFLDQTSELVTGLPAWAEAQYLPRLSLVRWSAMAFTRLHPSDTSQSLDQLEQLVAELRNLADGKPEGGSEALVERLRERATELAGKADNRRIEEAIQQAQQYVRGIPDAAPDVEGSPDAAPAIASVYEFLGLYEEDPDFVGVHVVIAALREKVYEEMMRRQAGEQADVLRVQWQNVRRLTSHRPQPAVFEVSARMLLQQVVAARAALVLEGIATTAYDELESELRDAVEKIESTAAERAEERQAKAMRSYQRWALSEIKAFEDSFQEISDKTKQDPGWSVSDARYQEVSQAMINHLLPINLALLDLPVQERYQQKFQEGWDKLDGREEQTAVAEASALTGKKPLRDFLED